MALLGAPRMQRDLPSLATIFSKLSVDYHRTRESFTSAASIRDLHPPCD